MKSDGVTKVWEFYRDNCAGFKEPMRKELRKLDDYVASVEAENAKLRELVQDVNKAAHMLCEAWEGSCSKEAEGMSLHAVCPISDTNELCVFGKLYDRMRELGIEVDA